MNYEYDILIGIVLGIILIIVVLAIIIERFLPGNKCSKVLKKMAEWIAENIP